MSDDFTKDHRFVMLYFLLIVLTIFCFCQFEVLLSKEENILLLIELKYKLLRKLLLYKQYKHTIYDITITYFIKTLFKEIFEKW